MSEVRFPIFNRRGVIVATGRLDAADFEWLGRFRWNLTSHGYLRRSADGRKVYMHREVTGLQPGDGMEVDHINGDKCDNRRSNLRVVTHQQNSQNRHYGYGTSRHRGVSWSDANNGWVAVVRIDGERHHLGTFKTEQAAADAASSFLATHSPYSRQAWEDAA